MFKSLQPLLAERSIHILLKAGKDGRIAVYVEPAQTSDKEDAAFITPFRCEATAEELNAELPAVLTQWLATRSTVVASLTEALAAAEATAKAAVEDAKKKAAERNKKVTPTVSVTAKAAAAKATAMPSLLDDLATGVDADDETDGKDETVPTGIAAAPAISAPPVVVAAAAAQAVTPTLAAATPQVSTVSETSAHAASVSMAVETESLF